MLRRAVLQLLGAGAFLAGLSCAALALGVRVVEQSGDQVVDVSVNGALVLESDEPFADLSVANPEIADIATMSPTLLYLIGKAPGRTSLTLLNAQGALISNIEVRVSSDISELKQRLREVLPTEPIEVRSAATGLVLSGTVSSAQAIDRALDLAGHYAPGQVSNLMQVGGTQQVMMKVRFAEMNRSVRKSLASSLALSSSDVVLGTGRAVNPLATLSGAGRAAAGQGAMQISLGAGNLELSVLLEALEAKGAVRTLAEPNLTALSGQSADFLAGGEYPVPVADGDGGTRIEYRPFGINLEMTPNVVGQSINLRLKAEASAIDPTLTTVNDATEVNGFSTRRSTTTVELRDGESFAIAGLLADDFRDQSAQVPWLGDVPILGALFRSAEYAHEQTELVIIVTAWLVTPTRGDALALPTDRIRAPNERELFLNGRTAVDNRPLTGAAGEIARQDFSGPYGYVIP